jgi:hypothetical protein
VRASELDRNRETRETERDRQRQSLIQ